MRHGQTNWNAEKRFQGQKGPRLNESGILNAEEAAEALMGKKISCIISSDMTRTRETGEIISKKVNAPLHFNELLRERNVGELSGLTVKEAMEKYPDIKFSDYDFGLELKGLEKWSSFTERTIKGFHEIIDAYDGDIVIVTHGGVIQVIKRHLGASQTDQVVPNGSILQIMETSKDFRIIQS